jgi:hypothetical protein
VREHVEAGEDADHERPREDRARDQGVEQRLDDQRRAERRVGGAVDAVLDEVELEQVAAAGRDDRVDAHSGEVGAEYRSPRNLELGVGRPEDVPPRRGPRGEPEEVEAERDRERQPVDVRQVVEELPGCVDDLAHADPG